MPRKRIPEATKNKDALHRALNVPLEKKTPRKQLTAALHSSNPTIVKEVHLAETLEKLRPKRVAKR